jgi:hypothetical protein
MTALHVANSTWKQQTAPKAVAAFGCDAVSGECRQIAKNADRCLVRDSASTAGVRASFVRGL